MKKHYRISVTPELATEWLKTNTKNRIISQRTVDEYARDMEAGAWRDNGDAIRFHKDGHLADGQHRLLAIQKAQATIECSIVEGLDDIDMMTVDCGRRRTAGDNFAIMGESYGAQVAATIRVLYGFATGSFSTQLTMSELSEILDMHPGIRKSVAKAHRSRILRPAYLAAIHYIGSHVHNDAASADSFVRVLISGEPAYRGDPAYLLRERLIEWRIRGIVPKLSTLGANVFYGFEGHREKRALKSLRALDSFEIKGWNEEILFLGFQKDEGESAKEERVAELEAAVA